MPVIAITGGIGSGKSLVLSLFEQAGCDVINMDTISRQLTAVGQKSYRNIVEAFGNQILASDKSINRSALAHIIFNNDQKRQLLERILHPGITRKVREILDEYQQDSSSSNTVLIEIPLLHDRKQFDFIDRILVIESSPELQLERVLARDSSRSSKDIQDIINSQISDLQREELADDILYNQGSAKQLKSKVQKLYDQYQLLA